MKSLNASIIFLFAFTLIFPLNPTTSEATGIPTNRPPTSQAAKFARWLVHGSSWGVLNTLNASSGGFPFGNVMSYSDGNTGIPYFYLTRLDPTGELTLRDPRASFTLSEYALGFCSPEPQDPLCSKITLTGILISLPKSSKEAKDAKKFFLKDHPTFGRGFSADPRNGFKLYKLDIQNIFLVNNKSPPAYPSVDEYFRIASM